MFLWSLYTNYAFELLTVLWIVAMVRSILFWLNFVQIKQYRIDRIWYELKHPSFWKLFFSTYRSLLIGFFITWQLLLRTSVSSQFGAFDILLSAMIVFFFVQALQTVHYLKNQRLQMPVFTLKIWVIFVALLLVEFLLASFYSFWPEQLLAIELLQPFIVIGLFVILWVPNFLLQKRRHTMAREKRLAMRNLKVIGITGSFGKTTMKEMLAHLLSAKFSVLKTPKHLNVDTGIANLVLDELTENHEIFIVEMGAYRKGEIKRISDIVLPDIAVLTALSNQHKDLFGSLEAIEKTKFELVDAVKSPSKIFANAESKPLMHAFEKRGITPVRFGFTPEANYQCRILERDEKGTVLEIAQKNFSTPLFGTGAALNLTGAIAVAKSLGMTMQELQERVKTLPQIDRTMELKLAENGAMLIDDTYNANTDGVLRSMQDIAEAGRPKKYLVFQEVLELGDDSDNDHRRIARAAAGIFDGIMLLSSEKRDLMRSELLAADFDERMIFHPHNLEEFIKYLDTSAIVLFEGRGADRILRSIKA